MLSTEQRKECLEELLARVQRNRSKLGPPGDDEAAPAPPLEAAAPPTQATAPKPAPPAEEEPAETIELDTDIAEVELDDEPIELDMSEEADDAMVIDLSPSDESLEEEVEPPPAARPETPTPLPKVDAAADPDDTIVDDEPEIEVAYGTEEALALQAEFGLGDEVFPPGDTLPSSDQLTLENIQQGEEVHGQSGAAIEDDDLPAQAPQEADLDDLLEPSMVASGDANETPLAPAGEPDDLPTAPKDRLRPRTEEDIAELMIELTLDDEVVAQEEVPTPVPGEAAPPAEPIAEEKVTDTSVDDLAAALSPTTEASETAPLPSKAEAGPMEEPTVEAEPMLEIELSSDAEVEVEPEPAPAPAEAVEAEKISGPKPDAKAVVAEISGAAPPRTVSSFGALLRNALSVGKKD